MVESKRTCNDVVRETEAAREWPDFPADVIALGANGGGDQLVFLRRGEHEERLYPRVYRWDHDTGELHEVAEDFGESTVL